MAGWTSLDDYVSETTVAAKAWRQEWALQTGAAVQAVSCAYDLNCYTGNPPTFLYTGVAKTFVAMDSTPVNITTGTCNGTTSVTGVTNDANIKIGMLLNGSTAAGPLTAGISILNIAVAGTTTLTLSANAPASGTLTAQAVFPTIWHGGNQAADVKSLVSYGAGYYAAAFGPNFLKLYDILGYYPIPTADLNSTSQRTLTNTITLPRYTTGAGVRAFFVITVAPTGGGPNLTEFTYVNQAGTGGRTCPVQVSFNAAATSIIGQIPTMNTGANKFIELPLAAGDTGIRSVTTYTTSGGTPYATSGAGALVLAKPLVTLPITVNGVYAERNCLIQSPPLTPIVDGACLTFINYASAATTANTTILGHCEFGWG